MAPAPNWSKRASLSGPIRLKVGITGYICQLHPVGKRCSGRASPSDTGGDWVKLQQYGVLDVGSHQVNSARRGGHHNAVATLSWLELLEIVRTLVVQEADAVFI